MTVAILLKHSQYLSHNPGCHSASGRPRGTYPETGFEEIGSERQSVAPHVSQADFSTA